MAIDKSRRKAEIKREISDRGRDIKTKLKDAQKVTTDKKTEANTAKSLRLAGSSEGANEVKKNIQRAADATDKEFKKKDRDLQKNVLDKAKKTEKELKQRSEAVKEDVSRLKQAAGKIDTRGARGRMQEAVRGGQQDGRFLGTEKQRQERDRIRGEKEHDKQKRDMNKAQVRFRN